MIDVLILDDSKDDAMLEEIALQDHGFKVRSVHTETREDFISHVTKQDWDVALLDYSLPGFSGLNALALLQEHCPKIPGIIVTGALDDETAVDCIKKGAADYVLKNNLTRLGPAVSQAIEARKTREERDRAIDALRKSEAKYRALFETAPVGVCIVDADSNFMDVNEWATSFLKESREKILGRSFATFIDPPDLSLVSKKISRILNGKNALVEAGLLSMDNEKHRCVLLGRPWNLEDQTVGGLIVIVDITEQRALEDQLRHAQKMETIGTLAGGVAHDFSNILCAIGGYVDLSLMKLDSSSPIYPYLTQVQVTTDRARTLTGRLLLFSRKQSSKPYIINLNKTIEGMGKMLSRLISEDIEIKTNLASDLGNIKADPGQMEQVIVNLVINARDAMPNGGILLLETSNVDVQENSATEHARLAPGSYVLMTVSDTGCGIKSEIQNRIFEPFFTTKEAGTGLGLAVIYGIVKDHGGTIVLESTPDKGSIFKVYLNRVESPVDQEIEIIGAEYFPHGTETVLLVEDDEVVRELAQHILDSLGYTVLVAGSGHNAMALCDRHSGPVHLLLTDVVMPSMNGFDLANIMCKKHPNLKVLFMSGYPDKVLQDYNLQDFNAGFIQKPFTAFSLARKVRNELDS